MDQILKQGGQVETPAPSFREAFGAYTRIGFLSFGGPAAQIALMHRIIVEEKQWLDEKQYLNALGFCMLLPGPEAMQIATYTGWRLHGVPGGLAAGLMFVLPGAFVILGLAMIYAIFGSVPLIAALFIGVKAAVLIVVLQALRKVASKALHGADYWVLALGAFIGLFVFDLPFPLIIVLAAFYGFLKGSSDSSADEGAVALGTTVFGTLRTILIWLVIWWAPIVLLMLTMPDHFLIPLGQFFSKLATVTFGGAYAVLAYMAQDVVGGFGWLTSGEMMDGLGLAETTPGPLILVTEFVGFFAGYREGGLTLGIMAALLTLWVTFAPCFLWIFAGAPYVDWIGSQPRLRGALNGITAAVVGVILNLSIWFGLHVFFGSVKRQQLGPAQLWIPDISSINWLVVALSVMCGVLLFRFQIGLLKVLGLAALIALVVQSI